MDFSAHFCTLQHSHNYFLV